MRNTLEGLALLAAVFSGRWFAMPERQTRPQREHRAVYGMNGPVPEARRRRQIAKGMLKPNGR